MTKGVPSARLPSRRSSSFCFEHVFTKANSGKVIDSYEVDPKVVGEGHSGYVCRCKCRKTGAERALKTIELKAVVDMKRFEQETDIQMQLDHPNIVRLYETFRDDTKVYLVMEYCTGGEFYDRIVEAGAHGFDEPKAAAYIKQVLASIGHLHANGIVHRDIKPENFLMQNTRPDAKLKLIDFGLSARFSPKTPLTTRVGTPFYVAPEVLKRDYDEKCDIWSIGVVLYILFCGYLPFNGHSDAEIFRRVREGKVEFTSHHWDKVSEAARGFIKAMLTKNPAERPSALELLKDPWFDQVSSGAIGPIILDFPTRLHNFQAHPKLKKVALTALAQQLRDEDIEPLQNTFRALDADGDGKLSQQNITEGMLKFGLKVPKTLDRILESVDSDGSGLVDYSEFLAATIDKKLYTKRDMCLAAFHTFDLDNDGKITQDGLSKVLKVEVGQGAPAPEAIKRMIDDVDTNGDGSVDFQEFFAMMSPARKRHRTKGPPRDS